MSVSNVIKGVVGGGRDTVTAPIIKEDYGLYDLYGTPFPEFIAHDERIEKQIAEQITGVRPDSIEDFIKRKAFRPTAVELAEQIAEILSKHG